MSILISIVSHKQAYLVQKLLGDIERFCSIEDLNVVVTINIEETIPFKETDFIFRLKIIRNETPQGFGANHNKAFKSYSSDFFYIVNPDVRLIQDPFLLHSSLVVDKRIGIIAPLILNGDHSIGDNARRIPTPFRLIKRILIPEKDGRLEYTAKKVIYPDWVAGIFMVFPSNVFTVMKGFDEKYFLYFEDVDLCCRVRLSGFMVMLDPRISVVHQARRDSHNNSRYLKWHIQGAVRFFGSRVYWLSWLLQFKKEHKKTI